MSVISDAFAAELIAQLRASHERSDPLTGGVVADNRDLLLLKLWDDLQAIKRGVAFLGVGGGIKPVERG